jgi:hypothetical protein
MVANAAARPIPELPPTMIVFGAGGCGPLAATRDKADKKFDINSTMSDTLFLIRSLLHIIFV